MTIARDRWEEDGCKLSAGECLNPEGVSFHQGQQKNSRLMSRERSVTDDLPVLSGLRGFISVHILHPNLHKLVEKYRKNAVVVGKKPWYTQYI